MHLQMLHDKMQFACYGEMEIVVATMHKLIITLDNMSSFFSYKPKYSQCH